MNDESNLTAVDAHTERVGGDNHALRRIHEPLLHGFPLGRQKAGMVCGAVDTCAAQAAVDFVHIFAGAGVDDSERRPSRKLEDRANLLRRSIHLTHFEIQVGAIESAHHLRCLFDAQLSQDVAPHCGRGGCGQCQHRRGLKLAHNRTQSKIVGTEVMPPKRNAMRFVDGKQADLGSSETGAKLVILETLGRNVEQLDSARDGLLEPALLLLA